MPYLEAGLIVGLSAILAASAFAKLAYWEDVVDWFSELFPRFPPTYGAVGAVTAEAVVIGLVLGSPRLGGAVAILWLLLASGVLFQARRRVSSCGCFGRRQQLGAGVALRNLTAVGLAVAVTITSPAGLAPEPVPVGVGIAAGIAIVVLREALDRRGILV